MRIHEIAAEDAISIDTVSPAIRLIAVPIHCTCIAPVAVNRYEFDSSVVLVKINGMVIGDADIHVQNYEEGGREAAVEFTGTVPIFAEGIMPAIELARLPRIEFLGWVNGLAHTLKIRVIGEVVMMTPIRGKLFSLVGADHCGLKQDHGSPRFQRLFIGINRRAAGSHIR